MKRINFTDNFFFRVVLLLAAGLIACRAVIGFIDNDVSIGFVHLGGAIIFMMLAVSDIQSIWRQRHRSLGSLWNSQPRTGVSVVKATLLLLAYGFILIGIFG